MINKKIKILIFLLPSILFNYLTLTLIDSDNNLSSISTIIILIFNLTNIFLLFIFLKSNLKQFLYIFLSFFLIFSICDYGARFFEKKRSLEVYDKELGWILNKSLNKSIIAKSKKGRKYEIEFFSSDKFGFREFSKDNINKKNIVFVGDSYTAGPFASNSQMYYSHVRKILIKNNYNFDFFVMGGGGYGTLQQLLLIKRNLDLIKPDLVVHQFCNNDFENNSLEIETNSILRNQYMFRPYLVNNLIVYKEDSRSRIYKFLFHNSYFFKKIDQIIINLQYNKNSNNYYLKKISPEISSNSIDTTKILVKEIRKIIGKNTIYISTTCSNKNEQKNQAWEKIILAVNGYPMRSPMDKVEEALKNDLDVLYKDGAHLNDEGNLIYGEELGFKIINLLNSINF